MSYLCQKIGKLESMKYLLIYIILINLVTFVVYADDKRRAKRHSWRTSEATLVTLAAIGGSVGALLAMLVFRHKTRHNQFTIGIPTILIVQILLMIFLLAD